MCAENGSESQSVSGSDGTRRGGWGEMDIDTQGWAGGR